MSDELVRAVGEMYGRFPYPSPVEQGLGLKELRNLLTIFSRENDYPLAGKAVLDVGTGTGHRLVEAAKAFPETHFVAVDVSPEPLEIARKVALHEGVCNVEFHPFDLMSGETPFGEFDIALAMGVLHHLPDPAVGLHNLVRNISDDGIAFLYVYGVHGGRERMRRKQIVRHLLGGDTTAFEAGIRLVKTLGFDTFDYGWNLELADERARDVLIVDAYLNVNEVSYDMDGVFDLVSGSGLDLFTVYGLTLERQGLLVDTRLSDSRLGITRTTRVADELPSAIAQEAYERLTLAARYRLLDLLYQPNGYTILGLGPSAVSNFAPEGRVLANALRPGTPS